MNDSSVPIEPLAYTEQEFERMLQRRHVTAGKRTAGPSLIITPGGKTSLPMLWPDGATMKRDGPSPAVAG